MGRMNDQLTSLRPVVPGAPGRPGRPGGGNSGPSLTFFSGPNYTGRSVTITSSTTNFQQIGFNDQARSVRHSGRRTWIVCQDANFEGARARELLDPDSVIAGRGGAGPHDAGRAWRRGLVVAMPCHGISNLGLVGISGVQVEVGASQPASHKLSVYLVHDAELSMELKPLVTA